MVQTAKKEIEFPSEVKEFSINHNDKNYKFLLPEREEFRIREIFVQQGYHIPGLNKIKNATFIDIGANVGLFAIFAKLNCPDASVDCYEPAPNTLELLKRNTAQLDNVKVHSRGVANFTGKTKIFMSALNTGATSIKSIGQHQALDEYEIKLVEARAVIENKEKVDVLKIDTEGCEVDVLENLKQHNLFSKINFIMLEYHSEADRRKIDQLLDEYTIFGYQACTINRGLMKFIRTDLIGTAACSDIHVDAPL
jgi:FkbM family methyltransferase